MLQEIRREQLIPSPLNPRKTFDEPKLQELAQSVREKGVLEPLLVRPDPAFTNGVEMYEIAAGERRYRAATIAELAKLPCIVRHLTDVEMLEIMTIENLQRDDLHPLEEAEGYAALMKAASYDVARIAERIGKSEKYVYDRIKLLQLVPELREIFLAGEITAGHAILLARLSPTDQRRALGLDEEFGYVDSQSGGLFTADRGIQDELELEDLDEDEADRRSRKPVSVRELAYWITRHVRFRPEEADPVLFPETTAALEEAVAEDVKVVHITREHMVPGAARDEKQRTYGNDHWKRADGQPEKEDPWSKKASPTKTCEHSVLGVVVAGPGQGEAFKVCVAKKKCTVHWREEQKAANQRGAPNGAGTKKGRDSYAEQQEKWKREREQREAERARWRKARPRLMDALVEAVRTTPALDLVEVILGRLRQWGGLVPKQVERGETADDALRFLAFIVLHRDLPGDYTSPDDTRNALKKVGIDAKKIVNEVAPKPKPESKKGARKAAKAAAKKGGARARRRQKKAGVQTSAEAS